MGAAFLQQWLKTPAMIGAIVPSSRHLAAIMARRAAGAGVLVELGAGTGTITAELVRQHPAVPLILFEQNPALAVALRRRFPSATIVADCFHARTDLLADLAGDAVFVSSLPFRSLPAQIAMPTIACLHALLRDAPRRRLIQFTYQPRAPFTAPPGLAWRRCATVCMAQRAARGGLGTGNAGLQCGQRGINGNAAASHDSPSSRFCFAACRSSSRKASSRSLIRPSSPRGVGS